MITEVVSYLNTQLSELAFIKVTKGIAEQIQETKGDAEKTFPAEYCSKGKYEHVVNFDKKQSLIYHRITDAVNIEEEEGDVGCDPYYSQTYPMVLIACVKKSLVRDENMIDMEVAQTIVNTIGANDLSSLHSDLQVDTISVIPQLMNVDRYDVFDQEFGGIDMEIDFDYTFISVSYEVVISGTKSCFENLC